MVSKAWQELFCLRRIIQDKTFGMRRMIWKQLEKLAFASCISNMCI